MDIATKGVQQMTESVWVSRLFSATDKVIMLRAAAAYIPPGSSALTQTVRYTNGECMESRELPDHAIEIARYGQKEPIPQVCLIHQHFCFSEDVANLLRRFDLGVNCLNPIRLLRKDGVTPYSGNFFIPSFGEYKSAFRPEASIGFKFMSWKDKHLWNGPGNLEFSDDCTAVGPSALAGVDLWFDKAVTGLFFVSERLRTALKEAGLENDFRLFRCNLII